MLKQEQAEKELDQLRIKDWDGKRLKEVSKLPSNLARVGRFLFGRDPGTGKPLDWQKRREEKLDQKMPAEATRLRPAERVRLFATLWPHLGEVIEAAWQLCARLPYEIDYDRKGFRAPGDEAIAQAARWRFLDNVKDELEGFDPTPAWLAAWAPYLSGGGGADSVGLLLAAAIDRGGPQGEEVYETLIGSINRTHPIGAMGRHVVRALLVASKPEGWEAIEKLLLAAQRQEGLRQTILETVDEAHPEAFRRMLKLVVDHDLLRFSAAVRAAMVWFGLENEEDQTVSRYKKAAETVLKFLADDEARRQALNKTKGDELYLALWTSAYEDATKAVPLAVELLKDRDVERRFLAVRFLDAVQLQSARVGLREALADADLRVAYQAFEALRFHDSDEENDGSLFEPLVKLLERLPEKRTQLKPIGPGKDEIHVDPEDVADELADHLGTRSGDELLPYIPRMGGYAKVQALTALAEKKPMPPQVRELLFRMAGDRDGYTRERALDAIKKLTLEAGEAEQIEALLTRKSADLREQVLGLLGKQKADDALASADRLLGSKNANQRGAGLELLRQMVARKKAVAACRERARAYQESAARIDEHTQATLDAILDVKREVPTLDNALGLLDATQLTPVVAPQKRNVALITPAARAIVAALDRFIADNAEVMVTLGGFDDEDAEDADDEPAEDEDGERTVNPRQLPLGAISYELPDPDWDRPRDEDLRRMPLRELLTKWWNERPAKLRDADGLELVRARACASMSDYLFTHPGGNKKSAGIQKAMKTLLGGTEAPREPEHETLILGLIEWLCRLEDPPAADFLLDATETTYASVPDEVLTKKPRGDGWDADWRNWNLFEFWPDRLNLVRNEQGDRWTLEQKARYYRLRRWFEQPAEHLSRQRMDWDDLALGYEIGQANLADLTEQMLGSRGPEEERRTYYYGNTFDALEEVTRRPEPELLRTRPELRELVDRVRDRILEVELARGELPTAATEPARAINSVVGLDLLCRLLAALGTKGLDRRGYGNTRSAVFSQLIKNCYPAPEDTVEAFSERMRELVRGKIVAAELPVQLAFFNPRWVGHVEHFTGIAGLTEAVWWFYAHMRYETPELPESLEEQIRAARADSPEGVDAWQVMVQERTTLSEEDRDEGAVDTEWFRRVFALVGAKRWSELMEASRYACNDNGYRNAQRLADVLRGKASKPQLMREVRQRKLKESVRLLGLLPLAAGEKREADLQQRWKVLAEYRKYARGLSPLSREDAIRTGEIGLANLARTAGYADPNRLIWAMEWNEIQDLAAGPLVATVQDVSVTLALDDQAQPVLTVQRGDRPLKAVPPKVRKQKAVAVLLDRRNALKQQASRIRTSLEAMMIRGDTFRGEELPALLRHPLVARNLSRLLVLGEGIRGYPVADGRALEDYNGKVEPVKKDEVLRLAHPVDLLAAGDWHDWQAHCFRIERVQPFKQIFRELYVLTDAERADRTFSRRYSGQQVNPRQAMALFGSRGWRTNDGVSKTFSEQDLVAEVSFQSGAGTPLDVEGLTLDRVRFHRRGSWEALPLVDLPSRLFSEVLRDLDLVVSVAHVGGVDPEASASTVQMRAALATELCGLLNLKNVKLKEPHLLIDGQLGKYSLHLGSGTVHKMPGGALCIVSVPAQHRGRLFLPFADDDPRTAEVIAKLLLLARDEEIQDPGILDQLRR